MKRLAKGGEDEVGYAVDVGHVEGDDNDDGLRGQHDDGALDAGAELGEERLVRVGFGVLRCVPVRVAGFLAEALGFLLEDFRGVGFAQEDEAEALYDDAEDGRGPEYPAPGCGLADPGAGDGADRRPDEGCDGVDGKSAPALLCVPAVSDHAAGDTDRGGAPNTG